MKGEGGVVVGRFRASSELSSLRPARLEPQLEPPFDLHTPQTRSDLYSPIAFHSLHQTRRPFRLVQLLQLTLPDLSPSSSASPALPLIQRAIVQKISSLSRSHKQGRQCVGSCAHSGRSDQLSLSVEPRRPGELSGLPFRRPDPGALHGWKDVEVQLDVQLSLVACTRS